ncbi:hypothetical protein PPYR_02403 [Photinus pyralis]|uniref:SCAN domain-containing protein n=1 Tax=Photinus pyralis TaxID=7054 RepID=A0A5N4B7B2_PHOPY|nr:hypothetical protein PPYR_02403 [Photinus pyralis]
MSLRGRPRVLNEDIIKNIVISNKPNIVRDGKIIKASEIWTTMSREIKEIAPHALYTLVVNNRYNLKDILLKDTVCEPASKITENVTEGTHTEDTDLDTDSITNTNNDSEPEEPFCNVSESSTSSTIIDITFERAEFDDLVEEKQYSRKEKDRKRLEFRKYLVLRAGEWQNAITSKLWAKHKIHCAYQFKRNKIYNEKLIISGKCNCGSVLHGTANNIMTGDNVIINCHRTVGTDGKCGKRYLRNPLRHQIGLEIFEGHTTAMKYRIDQAANLMEPGDEEPPHVYKAQALHDAVKSYTNSQILNKNPIYSLAKAKRTIYKNTIHTVGLDPFFAIYWSKYQLEVYKQYALRHNSSIAIDATGSIIKKLIHSDKSKSKHIFLYSCVANTPHEPKFPVTQMISESQTTIWIWMWLMQWIQSGAPTPREVTCDMSSALLNAAVRAFTGSTTIESYADSIWEGEPLPKSYIRIDVAHFLKIYCNYLKNIRFKIKKFFLAAIGKLILAQNLEEAEEILFAIFVTALSDTEGKAIDGSYTSCEIHKGKLVQLLTHDSLSPFENYANADTENLVLQEDICSESTVHENRWQKWAQNIYVRACSSLNDNGDRQNAHYLPQLANKILQHMKWFPLWSDVMRNAFEYGRIPSSSASVEAEFSVIKSQLFGNVTLPIRADLFVFKHIEFLKGRLQLLPNSSATHNSEDQNRIQDNGTLEEIGQNTDWNGIIASGLVVTCPACSNNDSPSGAHKCNKCGKNVHVLKECSIPIQGEQEGFGEKRVCVECHRLTTRTSKDIRNLSVVENWRGLAESVNKSRYLRASFQENEFLLHEKLNKIPILNNGNSLKLRAINVKGIKVTLANTCAFDSIFQLFLSAVYDSKELPKACSELKSNLFFEMLLHTSCKGITRHTYYTRAILLQNIFPSKQGIYNSAFINCEVTVGHLCTKLFSTTPTLVETSICNRGCTPRVKNFPAIQIQNSFLGSEKWEDEIENQFLLGTTSCSRQDCNGEESTSSPRPGDFIIFEVYDTGDTHYNTTTLHCIPKTLQFSFMKEPFYLRGVVRMRLPKSDSDVNLKTIGHYTAISYRRDGSWVEYDDQKDSEMTLSPNFNAVIELIVYSV